MAEGVSLSLIIPAYNEEVGIRSAILANHAVLSSAHVTFELIVIDDGSKDATLDRIKETCVGLDSVRFHSQPNGGFGSAIRTGIGMAQKEYVMFVPVDSPLTEEVLDAFRSHIGEADVLVSYRRSRPGYSMRMQINSFIYHVLVSKLFSLRLRDYNWIHMYKRSMFEQDITIENGGIFMLAEVLIKARRHGYTFAEFPVEMRARTVGVATAASFKAAFRTARDMLKFYWEYRPR